MANSAFNDYLAAYDWKIEPIDLYEPIGYTLASGGKRLRPMLVELGSELFGGDAAATRDAAMAIEVFHNFTLLHDDLMDRSEMRRNRPTVHKKWDANTAILSGDAMMIKSYEFLARIPQAYWSAIFPLFTKTALEVCEGQQYDMEFERRDDVTLDDYFRMIRLKTSVLLACSLKTGAILAAAPETEAQKLYDFGIELGLAFQLQDDFLDVYGTEELLGKKIGGDILCCKKTFLLISALQSTHNMRAVRELTQLLATTSIAPEKKINDVRKLYNMLGIERLSQDAIVEYIARAEAILDTIAVAEEMKLPLRDFVKKLIGRTV